MRGKLIVIDGGDGSGKATQATLLFERLKGEGRKVEKLDFPRYSENFFGKLIRECLDGAHGDFLSIHPKIVSALYAADRFESRERIEAWLADGAMVICDRYVSANMMHQGSKIHERAAREAFLAWLDELEHGVFKVPRPDVVVYLEVPHTTRRKLYEGDTSRTTIDIAEQDDAHQKATDECAAHIASHAQDWLTIGCGCAEGIRSREEIHEDIYTAVSKFL